MNNRIQSGLKSKTLARMGRRAACRHIYRLRAVAEVLPIDVPVALLESARLLEERRALAVAANAICEEEKSRLARKLHDELALSLPALRMDPIWVRDNAADEPAAVVQKLTDMVAILDPTVAATRRMAADLRPLLLDGLGLIPGIEWLVGNFTQRCGVPCQLSLDKEPKLQEPYANAALRIALELRANVAKHANASQVSVALGTSASTVILVIQDDGCGFLTAAARKPQSLGLMDLREPAQLLGECRNQKRTKAGHPYRSTHPIAASEGTAMTRILIADDHAIVRGGLKRILMSAVVNGSRHAAY